MGFSEKRQPHEGHPKELKEYASKVQSTDFRSAGG